MTAARRADQVTYPQFWAEDAIVFYAEAESFGVRSLTIPYSGYWHLYPRAIALLGTRVPVRHVPRLYSAAALIGAASVIFALIRADLVRRWPLLALLGLAVLAAPFTGELWYILTNTQWVLALLLILACMTRAPATRNGQMAWLLAILAAGLTGPFSLVLWPCALLRLMWRRDRWSAVLAATLGICVAATLVPYLAHSRSGEVASLLQRAVAIAGLVQSRPVVSSAAGAGAALLGWGFVHGCRARDLPLAVCAAAGLLTLGATAFGTPLAVLAIVPTMGGRYVFLPWVLSSWTMLLLVDRGVRLAWVPVAAMALVAAVHFSLPPLVRYPWPADAACLEARASCHLEVNPSWQMGLPGRGPR